MCEYPESLIYTYFIVQIDVKLRFSQFKNEMQIEKISS